MRATRISTRLALECAHVVNASWNSRNKASARNLVGSSNPLSIDNSMTASGSRARHSTTQSRERRQCRVHRSRPAANWRMRLDTTP